MKAIKYYLTSYYYSFEKTFCEFFGLKIGEYDIKNLEKAKVYKKLKIDNLTNKDEIILNKTIESNIIDNEPKFKGDYSVTLSENDKRSYIKSVLKSELGGFAYTRSIDKMENALYMTLKKYFQLNKIDDCYIYLDSLILNNEVINNTIKLPYNINSITQKFHNIYYTTEIY